MSCGFSFNRHELQIRTKMESLVKYFTMLISIFAFIEGNFGDSTTNAAQTCSITQDELNYNNERIDSWSGSEFSKVEDCDELLAASVTSMSQLKAFVTSEIGKSDARYEKLKADLVKRELDAFLSKSHVQQRIEMYRTQVDRMNSDIPSLNHEIDELTFEKDSVQDEIDFYNKFLETGEGLSQRMDDDSNFATAKNCSYQRAQVGKLIREFNAIRNLLVGNSQSHSQAECFDEINVHIQSFEAMIKYRTGETRMNSLKSTYDARLRCLDKVAEDFDDEQDKSAHDEHSKKVDELQSLRKMLVDLKEEVANLKADRIKQGTKAIVKMLQMGAKIRVARKHLIKLNKLDPTIYDNVIKETYNCQAEYIRTVIIFSDNLSRLRGYKIIKDKMTECGETSNILMLHLASALQSPDLADIQENIYGGLADNIDKGDLERIKETMRAVRFSNFNYAKLFKVLLERNGGNVKKILAFIDTLSAWDQNVVSELFDEMKSLHLIDSQGIIDVARWMYNKYKWINQHPSNSGTIGDLESHLDKLKERFPPSVLRIFFNPTVMFATKDHGYMMRSDDHVGVHFKPQIDESGEFFRFEDEDFQKAFYVDEFKDEETKESEWRVRLAKGRSDDFFFWQLIPTDGAEYFYLKNKATRLYLSSEEGNVCKKMDKRWYEINKECTQREHMNRAVPDQSDKCKWMITDRLIRNSILPNRNQG